MGVIRHNLGPASAPWANWVDNTLLRLERYRRGSARRDQRRTSPYQLRSRSVTLTYTSGGEGVSPWQAVERPPWATRLMVASLATDIEQPVTMVSPYDAKYLLVSVQARRKAGDTPATIFSLTNRSDRAFSVDGYPSVELRICDLVPMPDPDFLSTSFQMELMLVWLP